MNHKSTYQQKKSKSYQFVDKYDDPRNQSEPEILNYYYQVATFAEPRSKRHNMRRYAVNSNNEFVNASEYWLTEEQYQRFIASKKSYEYRGYPVYSLREISQPYLTDIMTMKSSILRNDYDYTGFAPF